MFESDEICREKYLSERYCLNQLKSENEDLKNENDELKHANFNLKKINEHFKSTKAYKFWNKCRGIKGEIEKENSTQDIKNLKDIKVALISDQFTYDSFKYEFKIVEITPTNWLEQFKEEKPDLFFCESTWEGYCNGKKGDWENKITKDERSDRSILFEILKYCKENKIPTVFWNKEDPVHYNNEYGGSFSDTAKNFDYIFTSAEECIKKYKKDYNHPNVHSLMFAGQPKIFNPLNLNKNKIEEVVFAGSYYKNFEERRIKEEVIFDKIIKSDEIGLKIFDRTYYQSNPNIGFPEKYKKYTNPPIEYKETANLYKNIDWGININTITQSKTMFARRVFELILTNTNIISNYSKGMKELFGDNIFIIEEEFPSFTEDYEYKRLNNLYNVLENHTYTNRWKRILDKIGFPYTEDKKDVTITFIINNENEIEKFLNNYLAIDYNDKKLNFVLDNSSLKLEELKGKYPQIDNIYYKNDEYTDKLINEITTEYFIITKNKIKTDFIKKAILHYSYLDKHYGIKENESKFNLALTNDFTDILFNRKMLNSLNKNNSFDIYYI
jgi:FtsZ-binding cell division protein ZapB